MLAVPRSAMPMRTPSVYRKRPQLRTFCGNEARATEEDKIALLNRSHRLFCSTPYVPLQGRGDKRVEYSSRINRLVLHFPAMSEKRLIMLLIVYLLELLVVAAAAFFLLRSALFPRGSESRGLINRGIRLCGALLLSVGAFVLVKLVL